MTLIHTPFVPAQARALQKALFAIPYRWLIPEVR